MGVAEIHRINVDDSIKPYEGSSDFTFGGNVEENKKIVESGFEMKTPDTSDTQETNQDMVDALPPFEEVKDGRCHFDSPFPGERRTLSFDLPEDDEEDEEDARVWKDRYFKLLEVVKTFKG